MSQKGVQLDLFKQSVLTDEVHMKQHGSRENRREAAALSPAEHREATVRAVTNIVRRLGVVLGAALEATMSELIKGQFIATAETLRDELKPLVDSLVHFQLQAGDDDGEA